MKKYLIPFILMAVTGCSSLKQISPALVQQGVSTTTRYALSKYPQAKPGVQIAQNVICSAANSTNIAPEQVVAAIQGTTQLTPESTLIINGALTLYIGIWDSYGADAVSKTPVLQTYLKATCDGLVDALGTSLMTMKAKAEPAPSVTWPLVTVK